MTYLTNYLKTEREAKEISLMLLRRKYDVARKFFYIVWRLKLTYRPNRPPFNTTYLADRLAQQHTFGKYDGAIDY